MFRRIGEHHHAKKYKTHADAEKAAAKLRLMTQKLKITAKYLFVSNEDGTVSIACIVENMHDGHTFLEKGHLIIVQT